MQTHNLATATAPHALQIDCSRRHSQKSLLTPQARSQPVGQHRRRRRGGWRGARARARGRRGPSPTPGAAAPAAADAAPRRRHLPKSNMQCAEVDTLVNADNAQSQWQDPNLTSFWSMYQVEGVQACCGCVGTGKPHAMQRCISMVNLQPAAAYSNIDKRCCGPAKPCNYRIDDLHARLSNQTRPVPACAPAEPKLWEPQGARYASHSAMSGSMARCCGHSVSARFRKRYSRRAKACNDECRSQAVK